MTAEEEHDEDSEQEYAEHMRLLFEARARIIEHGENKRGVHGKIPCPKCGTGELHYGIASNGHVRAICMPGGCLQLIE